MSTLKTHNLQSPDSGSANIALTPNAGMVVAGISTLGIGAAGGVDLLHQNVSRLSTQSYGIAVNGNILLQEELVHIGDTDTKIRFPAADTISFECAGEEILKIGKSSTELLRISGPIDASTQQEFGIGIAVNDAHTHPAAKITFKEFDASDSRGDLLFYTRGANSDSAPSERVRITSSGFVGINSAIPRTYLQVSKGSSHYNSGNPTAFNSNNVLACFENSDDVEVTLLSPNNKKNIINFGDNDNVANSSIEYDHSINHLLFKVNGGSERFRINNSGAFGLAGTNYGTAGQVLTSGGTNAVPTWSGGSTRVLEYFSVPCTGESVATSYGTRTTTSAGTAGYQLTTTWTEIVGSQITYRPPTGTHTVIYRFTFQVANHDVDGIGHFRFYVGSNEIAWARHTHRGDDYQGRCVFEWPIRIDSANANNYNHGRLQSWNSDLVLKMTARDYSNSYDMKIHMVNNWDGGGTDQFSMPTISITALGT